MFDYQRTTDAVYKKLIHEGAPENKQYNNHEIMEIFYKLFDLPDSISTISVTLDFTDGIMGMPKVDVSFFPNKPANDDCYKT